MTNIKVAIVGLGYVGLPLAVEFGKKLHTWGYDINAVRVKELNEGFDRTLEISNEDLKFTLSNISEDASFNITNNLSEIEDCNFYIVTVPTPIDKNNRPDLTPIYRASEAVGKVLKKGDVVVYESTVYPGVTEYECVPILESVSGLKFNIDFFAGYSPERINPGDKEHTLARIVKVTSGSTPEIATRIDELYKSIITAGTFKASSIMVAEAAKVIENAQRDINIAFVNELAKIFNKLGIDTNDILEAASTKWNFLKFKPGLVGGHCIGVDPYYLAQKAQEIGYHPEIILAGRRLNDSMGMYVAEEVVKNLVKRDIKLKNAKALICGFTFKENCPDVRNTKVSDIISELEAFNMTPVIYDPWADSREVKLEYGYSIENKLPEGKFEAIILAVAHTEFQSINLRELLVENGVLFDVKGILPNGVADFRL